MLKQVVKQTMMIGSAALLLSACGKSGDSYSLLPGSESFQQEAVFVPKKIDILWVMDNSGSMATSQADLASNFQSFIARFNQSNYDFHMAVVTTDGWAKQFNANSTLARIRDGAVLQNSPKIENHSGVFVMDKATPNLTSVFATNIKQGTLGNGDERAFESMKQSLMDPFNVAFRRSDAFLAVIIVSDEEDFSSSTSTFEDRLTANTYSVQSYVDYLDTYTGGTAAGRNYSVSSIYTKDDACKTQLGTDGFARKVSTRLPAISDLTAGVKASLCENFGTSLQLISDSIIQLSSVFKLNREPIPESIVIKVDGATIAQDATNGWTYDAATLTITFHGSAVPGANSDIRIAYDPVSIKN
jgi:hypothetical protein